MSRWIGCARARSAPANWPNCSARRCSPTSGWWCWRPRPRRARTRSRSSPPPPRTCRRAPCWSSCTPAAAARRRWPISSKKLGAQVHPCARITKAAERADFVRREFRALKVKVGDDTVTAVLDAVGSDIRELAAVCSQLVADTGGKVDAAAVRRYHSRQGRGEGLRHRRQGRRGRRRGRGRGAALGDDERRAARGAGRRAGRGRAHHRPGRAAVGGSVPAGRRAGHAAVAGAEGAEAGAAVVARHRSPRRCGWWRRSTPTSRVPRPTPTTRWRPRCARWPNWPPDGLSAQILLSARDSADFLLAAWFLWMTPLLAALSSLRLVDSQQLAGLVLVAGLDGLAEPADRRVKRRLHRLVAQSARARW